MILLVSIDTGHTPEAAGSIVGVWGLIVFYSDKHGVFWVNVRGATAGTGMTQFGRALNDLSIPLCQGSCRL